MKLLIAVIQHEDEDGLVQDLQDHDIGATHIGSSGGFLRASNVTLLIAVNDDQVDAVLEYLRKHCKRRTRHLQPLLPNLEARERFLAQVTALAHLTITVGVTAARHAEAQIRVLAQRPAKAQFGIKINGRHGQPQRDVRVQKARFVEVIKRVTRDRPPPHQRLIVT